jgi:hypothetical protein
MGLFGKKKEVKPEILYTDYINWDKDLGFLTLVITRKKNITKNYYINIYSTQLKNTDYIRDEDIQDIIINGVNEVINELSPSYKTFLITKYFKDEKELVKFITEDFYVDLTSAAIVQNSDKIKANMVRQRVSEIGKRNIDDDKSAKEDDKE